jgi:hypothetical protein
MCCDNRTFKGSVQLPAALQKQTDGNEEEEEENSDDSDVDEKEMQDGTKG